MANGLDEVAQWYFEVWNEPNIDFWTGEPKESTYYQLYDSAARAVKAVSPRLRVGGPATAQAAWVDRFLAHCKEKNVPVDFASTHVYGNDKSEDVFGTHEAISRNEMVCRAVKKVHQQIAVSAYPKMPLIWTEYNADYSNQPQVTDSAYMGPFLANTIRECDGLTEMIDDRQITASSQWNVPVWSPQANRFGWSSYLGTRYGTDDVPPDHRGAGTGAGRLHPDRRGQLRRRRAARLRALVRR